MKESIQKIYLKSCACHALMPRYGVKTPPFRKSSRFRLIARPSRGAEGEADSSTYIIHVSYSYTFCHFRYYGQQSGLESHNIFDVHNHFLECY